jgi:hypothetical protein
MDGFYTNLIGSNTDQQHTIDLDFLDIESHDLTDVDMLFSKEEVWNTIRIYQQTKHPEAVRITIVYRICAGWATSYVRARSSYGRHL